MITPDILTFAGTVFLLTLTPGADTMLVIKNVLSRGWQAGILTTLGISVGLLAHALLSSLGLSLILLRSPTAFEIIKWAGAGYLILLGFQSILRRSSIPPAAQPGSSQQKPQTEMGNNAFLEGLLTNLLNPKVAVFYLAFLPQFIHSSDPIVIKSILLAGIHILMGLIWLSGITLLLKRLRAFITRSAVQRTLEIVSGSVLIALGIRLIFTHH